MLPIEKNREETQKRTRIRLYKEHLGYLDSLFLEAFQQTCGVQRINRWIKEKVEQEFEMTLKNKEDIAKWTDILTERFYENPMEWVKEMMRREMYPSQKVEPIISEIEEDEWI